MVHHFARLKRFRFKHQTGALLAGFYLSTTVVAQITPEQERDIGVRNQQELQRQRQQQQEQQLRQQQERTPDVRLNTPEKETSKTLPIETPCFLIEHLQLRNISEAFNPEFDWVIEQLTSPEAPTVVGQCIGAQGVAWLIERAQKLLVDRGFVTSRVLAAQQDMSQNTLMLTLIPRHKPTTPA
jgi:hemolysin activation/secretion protein